MTSEIFDPKALAMPREFVFENGLRVITLSTPTLETARMNVRVGAGSQDDPVGYEGTAHFLEHMIFQGSIFNRGSKERAAKTDIMQAFLSWGGDINAGTSKKHTEFGFYESDQRILNENLSEAADILLDMVQHPRLKEEFVDSERRVIRTELATDKNLIGDMSYDAACRSLYPDSGLGHSILGTNESLDKITAAKLREFWNDHYVPSNVTIFIQGKASDEELLKTVTDRLTVLGTNRENKIERPPLQFKPSEVRTSFEQAEKLCYRFAWETSCARSSNINMREKWILDVLVTLLSNEGYIKMCDQEHLVYSFGVGKYGHNAVVFSFDSEQFPKTVVDNFSVFIKDNNMFITQKALDELKKRKKIEYIKFFEDPKSVALGHKSTLEQGIPTYSCTDHLRLVDSITLEEVRDMASRIFGKPFGMALVGKPELLEQVPSREEIAAAMNLPKDDRPVVDSFPMPDNIKPYDARQGETTPRRNPAYVSQGVSGLIDR